MTRCCRDSQEGVPEEVPGPDHRARGIPQGGQEGGFGLQACAHPPLLGGLDSGAGTISLCLMSPTQRLAQQELRERIWPCPSPTCSGRSWAARQTSHFHCRPQSSSGQEPRPAWWRWSETHEARLSEFVLNPLRLLTALQAWASTGNLLEAQFTLL